jgi:heme exporter protein C
MKCACKTSIKIYWALTALIFIAAIAMAAFYAPVESTMGVIQKIFYLHLPSAINTFVAFLIVFVASIGYLTQRKPAWDDLAASAAKTGVFFCTIVLVTGMAWAKGAWGSWWTWSPRLTFSLLLWLLYVVYLLVRASIDSDNRKGVVCAVYGIVAFLDVPLVYLSAKLLPDIHPGSIALAPQMKLTLAFWFLPVTLLNIGLIAAGYAAHARRRAARGAVAVETGALRPMNLQLLGEQL